MPEVALEAVKVGMLVVLGAFGWSLRRNVAEGDKQRSLMQSDIAACKTTIREIETNYIDRFDEVKGLISRHHGDITNGLSEMRVRFAELLGDVRVVNTKMDSMREGTRNG